MDGVLCLLGTIPWQPKLWLWRHCEFTQTEHTRAECPWKSFLIVTASCRFIPGTVTLHCKDFLPGGSKCVLIFFPLQPRTLKLNGLREVSRLLCTACGCVPVLLIRL